MGIYAVADGIGASQDANQNAQNAMAIEGIFLAPAILQLTQQYMEAIEEDSYNYSMATVNAIADPSQAAVAAQWNVQKDKDQAESDLNTGNVTNITETLKSMVGFLGQNLDDVFKFEGPIIELLAQTTSLIVEL